MFRNRPLVVGIGAGLIAGAILLQLMNIVAEPKQRTPIVPSAPPADQLDAKQIGELAAKYYQVIPKDQKVYKQADVDALVQQKIAEERQKQAASAEAAAPAKKTYIYVSSGQNATQVGDMLFQSGLISDRKLFETTMTGQQLNSKIIAGVHIFEGQPDLSQIIANLTTR